MSCIVCGNGAGYLCSIRGLGVSLCGSHLDNVSWDRALRVEPA